MIFLCFAVDGCFWWFGCILTDRRRKTVWEQNDLEHGPKSMHGCHANSILENPGRFGPGSFRPGSFRPESFRPNLGVGRFGLGRWVDSALGRFGQR